MSDTTDTGNPVFSLARHRELVRFAVERAQREERDKIAAAIDVQGNTLGGLIGTALHQVANDLREAGAMLVAMRDARDVRAANPEDDPAFNHDIAFEHLTKDQQQRRLARLAEESREAAKRLAKSMREDDERIERERRQREENAARGVAGDREPVDELPPVVLTTDEEDFHNAQRKLR